MGGRRQSPARLRRRRLLVPTSNRIASLLRALLQPEPAMQMDYAFDALARGRRGFSCSISPQRRPSIEAMGRAIGFQAIVLIREVSGLRGNWPNQ